MVEVSSPSKPLVYIYPIFLLGNFYHDAISSKYQEFDNQARQSVRLFIFNSDPFSSNFILQKLLSSLLIIRLGIQDLKPNLCLIKLDLLSHA